MTIDFEILKNYVPEKSLPFLQTWFQQRSFKLKITKKRATKFGDFRIDKNLKNPQISVNSNLNQYAFLITLTHEFAHLLVWKKHQFKVKAHGEEWKNEFFLLMNVLLQKNVFPNDITKALQQHMVNPAASSARDINLVRTLKEYDAPSDTLHLSELPQGSTFTINSRQFFIKGEKKRTRYLCKEVNSKKQYLVHGVAEVILVK